jgi:phage baseplate assembly protein W
MYKDIEEFNEDDTDLDAIKNSIRNILLTPRGSLPGKPRFGSDLYKIIFSPLDPLTERIAKNYIQESLSEYEDRIIVNNIEIKKIEEYNRLVIDIAFSYVDSQYNDENVGDTVSLSVNV